MSNGLFSLTTSRVVLRVFVLIACLTDPAVWDQVEVAEPNPALARHRVREAAQLICRTAQDRYFEAGLVIEVDVQGGD